MLEGMYAFALHDRATQSLFLARDPYGIKPHYYAEERGTIRFASQARALGEGRADNPAGLVGFALLGHVPDPLTIFSGVKALEAGHGLWVRKGRVEQPVSQQSITGEFR